MRKKRKERLLSIVLIMIFLLSTALSGMAGNVKKAQADVFSAKVSANKKAQTGQGIHYLTPYQTTRMTCYTGDATKSFKMMGSEYFYGVVPENWGDFKQVLYNLDGQFQTVTLDVGHWDGWNDASATMYIYMDNQLVQEIALTNDMANQSLSFNTDGVTQLRFEMNKYGAFYGLGNVIGYGGHNFSQEITKAATPIDSGVCTYTCKDCGYFYEETIPANDLCTPYLTPYQTTNLVSYESTEDLTDYFCVMGKRYDKGMVPEHWGDKKEALYNLGKKYTDVSFYVGHWDNWEGSGNGTKLYVYADGAIVKEIELSNDMISQEITVNTENVSQLKITYECYGAFFAIYDMKYTAKSQGVHEFEREEILAPTWDSDGIIMYTCKNCGASYTEGVSYEGEKPSETEAPAWTEAPEWLEEPSVPIPDNVGTVKPQETTGVIPFQTPNASASVVPSQTPAPTVSASPKPQNGSFPKNTKKGKVGKVKIGKWKKTYDSAKDKHAVGDGVTYTVKWKKVKGASGYQVYTYEKGFPKDTWYRMTTNTKKRYARLSFSSCYAIKAKVRAYKVVNGVKVYGKWSKVSRKVVRL